MEENKHASDSESLKIEIVKYKWLLKALENPKLLWRLLISVSAMLVMLFFGLSIVAVIVKSMYPYETIRTNAYGATIMEDEKKEVVYWLFNSAELWAYSGIRVEKGDVLTIRSSGMMHTAIHHLVDEVKTNRQLTESWVNTEGIRSFDQRWARDDARADFRIAPNVNQNKLLMRVVDDSSNPAVDPVCYVIGKERTNLVIAEGGILQFAVNDIALTDSVICRLNERYVNDVCTKLKLTEDHKKAWLKFFDTYVKETPAKRDSIVLGPLLEEIIKRMKAHEDELPGVALGCYYGREDSYPILNEALYYLDKDFEEAWFADNVGSFLIVIERNKKN